MVASVFGQTEYRSKSLLVKAPEDTLFVSIFCRAGIDDINMIVPAENKFSGFAFSHFRGIVLSAGRKYHFIIYGRCDGLPRRCGNLYGNAFSQCHRSAIDRNRYGCSPAIDRCGRSNLDRRSSCHGSTVVCIDSDCSRDILASFRSEFQRLDIIVTHSDIDIDHAAGRLQRELASFVTVHVLPVHSEHHWNFASSLLSRDIYSNVVSAEGDFSIGRIPAQHVRFLPVGEDIEQELCSCASAEKRGRCRLAEFSVSIEHNGGFVLFAPGRSLQTSVSRIVATLCDGCFCSQVLNLSTVVVRAGDKCGQGQCCGYD